MTSLSAGGSLPASGSTSNIIRKDSPGEESPYPPGRVLQRAPVLLTAKGHPVPAIADNLPPPAPNSPQQLYLTVPPSPGTTTKKAGTHRRAHSNTVPSSSYAPPPRMVAAAPESNVSRRRSLGNHRLSIGSIRQGVMDASTFIYARRSKSQSPPTLSANTTSLPVAADTADSENTSPSLSSSDRTVVGSRPMKKGFKRHFKSASDALASWQRPRIQHSVSEPAELLSPLQGILSADAASVAELPMVEGLSLTALAPVTSPESVPKVQVEVEREGAGDMGDTQEGTSRPEHDKAAGSSHQERSMSSPLSPSAHMTDFTIPDRLVDGLPMLKVSPKKRKWYEVRLDPDQGQILWNSKKLRVVPIEAIKEIRTGIATRYYREQFQLAASYEDRWFTISYVIDSQYKTLHLIAQSREDFCMWDQAIRRLYEVREQLKKGLGHGAMRQAVWEKQFWKGADAGRKDNKLEFEEVVSLCRRMNITPSRDDLLRRFKGADSRGRGYLDFNDFRKFVTSLKTRPDVDRLFKKLVAKSGATDGALNYTAFVSFMRHEQKSSLADEDLQSLFVKYASPPEGDGGASAFRPPASPARNPLELAIQSGPADRDPSQLSPPATPAPAAAETCTVSYETGVWTCKAFTSFLLSPENTAFIETKQDMTRPLPEYFISSSHNTYIVGHQLVGENTIEGYIRAFRHGCRSVELDVFDGEIEPVIYHGRTLMTKMPLRIICQTIADYGFVNSPYPIIISVENHCSVPQQVMMAKIMSEIFGDALVKAPLDGRPKIDVLPSPEDLKGRVLVKAKNLYLTDKDDMQDREFAIETESSSTETSTSDTDFKDEVKHEVKHEWRKVRANEAEAIKGFKSELSKAKKVLERVKPRRASENITTRPALSPSISPVQSRTETTKVRMAPELASLLVYTVGVKCRGLNKKEVYAPEHMFSLSEKAANRFLKQSMMDLIKHNRTHLVRIYPKGTRIGSTNFEPHRYWSAGAQLAAINWQTPDLGYALNHAMFEQNGRVGYVLKPPALRNADKQLLSKRTKHFFDVKIISAQQLPRPTDSLGREIVDKGVVDPYVEVSLHIPDWTHSPFLPAGEIHHYSPPTESIGVTATSARTVTVRTTVVKNNGWNPVWEEKFSLPFDCVGDMLDLVFVRFAVRQEGEDEENLGVYCTNLSSLNSGYRHLPLHDSQLSQYLFSTIFVKTNIRDA